MNYRVERSLYIILIGVLCIIIMALDISKNRMSKSLKGDNCVILFFSKDNKPLNTFLYSFEPILDWEGTAVKWDKGGDKWHTITKVENCHITLNRSKINLKIKLVYVKD